MRLYNWYGDQWYVKLFENTPLGCPSVSRRGNLTSAPKGVYGRVRKLAYAWQRANKDVPFLRFGQPIRQEFDLKIEEFPPLHSGYQDSAPVIETVIQAEDVPSFEEKKIKEPIYVKPEMIPPVFVAAQDPLARFSSSMDRIEKNLKINERVELSWTRLEEMKSKGMEGMKESPYEVLTKKIAYLRKRIEKLDTLAKLSPDPKKVTDALIAIDTCVDQLRDLLDRQFRHFATIIGVKVAPDCKFSKKIFDASMESCFGTLGATGNGRFSYPGMQNIRLSSRLGVHKVFSLYLSRKCFTLASPDQLASSLDGFFNRVCTPRPAVKKEEKERAYLLMESICKALFNQQSSKRKPYNSGKACYEVPRSMGGKRVAEHVGEADFSGRGRVKPAAIFSAGKIRVITVDSAFNARFAYLNKYMADRIRKCGFSIFGKTIEKWLEEHPEFLEPKEGENYISGDLESATDFFDPELARIVIRRLAEIYPDFEDVLDVYSEICSFTTDADLEVPGTYNPETHQPYTRRQLAGQLMGSIVSFPILCLVNLVSFLLFRPEGDAILEAIKAPVNISDRDPLKGMRTADYTKVWNILKDLSVVGINGDDIVFKGTPEEENAWIRGVEVVGGVVSRGKTLRNPVYFTVNSEIGAAYIGILKIVRPSLTVCLSDGKFKAPHRSWGMYLNSPLRSPESDDIFKPERAVFPDMPKFFGGLGLNQTGLEEFDLTQFLTLLDARPRAVYDFRELKSSFASNDNRLTHTSTARVNVEKISPANVPLPGGFEYKKGLMARTDLQKLLRKKYTQSPTTIMWSEPTYTKNSLHQSRCNVMRLLKFMTLEEVGELFALYKFGYHMDARGLCLFEGETEEEFEVIEETSLDRELSRGLAVYRARKSSQAIKPKPTAPYEDLKIARDPFVPKKTGGMEAFAMKDQTILGITFRDWHEVVCDVSPVDMIYKSRYLKDEDVIKQFDGSRFCEGNSLVDFSEYRSSHCH